MFQCERKMTLLRSGAYNLAFVCLYFACITLIQFNRHSFTYADSSGLGAPDYDARCLKFESKNRQCYLYLLMTYMYINNINVHVNLGIALQSCLVFRKWFNS